MHKLIKRSFQFGAIALIPIFFFLNTWQSFRYSSLRKEIRKLENEQAELIEENKRRIITISILESPARIKAIANETLRLRRPDSIIYLEIGPSIHREKSSDG